MTNMQKYALTIWVSKYRIFQFDSQNLYLLYGTCSESKFLTFSNVSRLNAKNLKKFRVKVQRFLYFST